MNVIIKKVKGSWREIADAANTTIHKSEGQKEVSPLWKKRMLLCEHSPIRQLIIKWKWNDLISWVSVHFVRHKIGIEHWVRSQRTDRTNIPRETLPQDTLIEHECEANAQAIINISRKRLCYNASRETRIAWKTFLQELKKIEPELSQVCVPDCIYRGYCYEFKSCDFYKTPLYKIQLLTYRKELLQCRTTAPESPIPTEVVEKIEQEKDEKI